MKIYKCLLVFFCAVSSTAFSQSSSELSIAKTILCNFPVGSFNFSNDAGKYEGIKKSEDKSMSFSFDSINLQENKARMIGNAGGSDVHVDYTPHGLHFIEITSNGNRIYTTIYPTKNQYGDHLATTSRHLYVPNSVLSSQWYGICRITDAIQ